MRIDNIGKNNVNTKGYLDKSVIRYFENTHKNIQRELKFYRHNSFDIENFKDLTNAMSETLKSLNLFVKNLHPNTALKIRTSSYGSTLSDDIYFENNKTESSFRPYYYLSNLKFKENESDPYSARATIRGIEKWLAEIEELEQNGIKIDSILFDNMIYDMKEGAKNISIIGYIKNFLNSRKADKLAPEFGKEQGYAKVFNSIREEEIKKAKERSINNQKIDNITKDFINDNNLKYKK
jgi:hypothetical protein